VPPVDPSVRIKRIFLASLTLQLATALALVWHCKLFSELLNMPNNAESCKLNRYDTMLFVDMCIRTAKETINKKANIAKESLI